MLKFTVTYKKSVQISPDDFVVFTEVVHLKETDTLKQVYDKIMKGCNENMDVELHCSKEESDEESR